MILHQRGKLLADVQSRAGKFSVYRAELSEDIELEIVGIPDLTDEQTAVFNTAIEWFDASKEEYVTPPPLTIGGWAGCGKTVLISHLSAYLTRRNIKHAICAPTGKAASVIRRKLHAQGLNPAFCGTMHSLLYNVDERDDGSIDWKLRIELDPFQVIIIDEASMVSKTMLADVMSFGRPVIAVGDHGQLPPVGEMAGLMDNPVLRLETIHRQAQGNPILALAHHVRHHGTIPRRLLGESNERLTVRIAAEVPLAWFNPLITEGAWDTAVITYTNRRRTEINRYILDQLPEDGPKQVLILRNAKLDGVFLANGMRGILTKLGVPDSIGRCRAEIFLPDEELFFDGPLFLPQMGRDATLASFATAAHEAVGVNRWLDLGLLTDWAYALTCHKAQSDQWRNVIVEVNRSYAMDSDTYRRWVYTALTRASHGVKLACGKGVEFDG
jgi:exodeoxyribonuclease-5